MWPKADIPLRPRHRRGLHPLGVRASGATTKRRDFRQLQARNILPNPQADPVTPMTFPKGQYFPPALLRQIGAGVTLPKDGTS